jgi:hypothetical protein
MSLSWEINSCLASLEITRPLWDPNIRYRVFKPDESSPHPQTLLNFYFNINPISLRAILIVSSHLRLRL